MHVVPIKGVLATALKGLQGQLGWHPFGMDVVGLVRISSPLPPFWMMEKMSVFRTSQLDSVWMTSISLAEGIACHPGCPYGSILSSRPRGCADLDHILCWDLQAFWVLVGPEVLVLHKGCWGLPQSSPSCGHGWGIWWGHSGANCFSVEGSSKGTQGATAARGVLRLQMPFTTSFLTFKDSFGFDFAEEGCGVKGFLFCFQHRLHKKRISWFQLFSVFQNQWPQVQLTETK